MALARIHQTTLVLRGRRPIYYGWWLVLFATFSIAVVMGLFMWAFGLYIDPVEERFGWSRAEVSLGISVAILAGGLASPLAGRVIDRRGPRVVILAGMLGFGGGLLLLSTTSTLWQWYLFSAVTGMAVGTIAFIGLPVLMARWFAQRRGTAIGLLQVGVSVGGLAIVPILSIVIDGLGWREALLLSGALALVALLPAGWLLLRNNPPPSGRSPDETDRRAPAATPAVGPPLSVALRTRLFWVVAVANGLLFYGVFGLLVHSVPLFESRGISTAWAAGLLSLMAGVSILTRLLLAFSADRMRRFEILAMAITGCGAIGTLVLLADVSPVGLAPFVLLWSIFDAGPSLVEPMMVLRTFGTAHFASILGTMGLIRTACMLISPTVAGAIFDATGSYDWALVVLSGAFTLSMLLFAVAMRSPRPWFAASESAEVSLAKVGEDSRRPDRRPPSGSR